MSNDETTNRPQQSQSQSQSQPFSTSTNNTADNPSTMTPHQRQEALTQCLLSQYRFCAGGVVLGGGYSIARAKNVRVGPWP
eukprot:CAMPEP_0171343906 /NCGR_PEP_ID=MMETSP0878-20121228/18278_1 /TAXON_ID=67004 /ORGANISM="Thalassiosira weissflogii, Strain CCMP1336" /LENGTH=80 /DNA_ID=CAMNT_0011846961 /DNA_START=328 /DNA_END=566 /DNA_ORIENTATION=-